jgi:hypothetical protein
MTETKPWYLSKTILASFVTIAAAVAGMAGHPVGAAEASALTDALLQAVSAVAGIGAIFGRLKATARIG